MTKTDALKAVEAAKEALERAIEELEEADTPAQPEDVTDECEVEIGTGNDGAIRMYLTHNGAVITRAGLGKVLELTDFAAGAGYALVASPESTKRGSYFKVYKS